MAFTSKFDLDIPIINDTSHGDIEAPPPGQGRGRLGTSRYREAGVAGAFPSSLLIPTNDIQGWIKEEEEKKNGISDKLDSVGLTVKNQGEIPYCWIFGPVHCMEINRVMQNQEMIRFSPAWIGGIIKNWRAVGGWGLEGLKKLGEIGTVPIANCGETEINRNKFTAENKAIALKYRILEWTECIPRNNQQIASLVLRKIPVTIGLDWWGHQITIIKALWLDGALAWLINNSWGRTWGKEGRGILQGNKMLADDACAPFNSLAA